MNQQLEQDPSYSLQSDVGQQSQQKGHQSLDRDWKNRYLPTETTCNYVKQFQIHGKVSSTNKFPFHLYLKEHYHRLSLEQQIRIFQQYFETSRQNPSKQLIQFDPSHAEILNQGLNLFTKVPENAILFVSITNFSHNLDLIMIKNFVGEIVHFQTAQKTKRKTTLIVQLKRRIKGRPYLIINDTTNFDTLLNRKGLFKLAKIYKFLYIKKYKTIERSWIKNEFFENRDVMFYNLGYHGKIIVGIKPDESYFYSYSQDLHEKMTEQKFLTAKQQYFTHFTVLEQDEIRLLRNNVNLHLYNTRLLVFDTLYINFAKSSNKTKQQLVKVMQKMSQKYANTNFEEVEAERDHYPQRILNSRRCKHCQILKSGQNKKSKYKCLGCSKRFQMDVPLCIGCWGDFHQQIIPLVGNSKGRDLKKAYQSYQEKTKRQMINHLPFEISRLKDQYISHLEVKQAVLRLDENLNILQQGLGQLNFWQGSEKLLQKTTQYMLINIIECFNQMIDQATLEEEKHPSLRQSPQSNQSQSHISVPSENQSSDCGSQEDQF